MEKLNPENYIHLNNEERTFNFRLFLISLLTYFFYILNRFNHFDYSIGDSHIYSNLLAGQYFRIYQSQSTGILSNLFLMVELFYDQRSRLIIESSLLMILRLIFFTLNYVINWLIIENFQLKNVSKKNFLIFLLAFNPFSLLFFRYAIKRAVTLLFIELTLFSVLIFQNLKKHEKLFIFLVLIHLFSLVIINSPYGGLIIVSILIYFAIKRVLELLRIDSNKPISDVIFIIFITIFVIVSNNIVNYLSKISFLKIVSHQYFNYPVYHVFRPVMLIIFVLLILITVYFVNNEKIVKNYKLFIVSLFGFFSQVEIPLRLIIELLNIQDMRYQNLEVFVVFDLFPSYIIFLIGLFLSTKELSNFGNNLLNLIYPIFLLGFLIEFTGISGDTNISAITGQLVIVYGLKYYAIIILADICKLKKILIFTDIEIYVTPFFIAPLLFIYPNIFKFQYLIGIIQFLFLSVIMIYYLKNYYFKIISIFLNIFITFIINFRNPALFIQTNAILNFNLFLFNLPDFSLFYFYLFPPTILLLIYNFYLITKGKDKIEIIRYSLLSLIFTFSMIFLNTWIPLQIDIQNFYYDLVSLLITNAIFSVIYILFFWLLCKRSIKL